MPIIPQCHTCVIIGARIHSLTLAMEEHIALVSRFTESVIRRFHDPTPFGAIGVGRGHDVETTPLIKIIDIGSKIVYSA